MAVNTKILGVNLDTKKKILYSLQGIYGIGKTVAGNILVKVKIDPEIRTHELSEDQMNAIRSEVETGGYLAEGDLRQKVYKDIARLKSIKSYRGLRHRNGLPVRGQNTKKNARTRKGKVKMAVGGLNKPVSKK